jgi:hypothetical protein
MQGGEKRAPASRQAGARGSLPWEEKFKGSSTGEQPTREARNGPCRLLTNQERWGWQWSEIKIGNNKVTDCGGLFVIVLGFDPGVSSPPFVNLAADWTRQRESSNQTAWI